MSSNESEDDFQSADEGSDDDFKVSNPNDDSKISSAIPERESFTPKIEILKEPIIEKHREVSPPVASSKENVADAEIIKSSSDSKCSQMLSDLDELNGNTSKDSSKPSNNASKTVSLTDEEQNIVPLCKSELVSTTNFGLGSNNEVTNEIKNNKIEVNTDVCKQITEIDIVTLDQSSQLLDQEYSTNLKHKNKSSDEQRENQLQKVDACDTRKESITIKQLKELSKNVIIETEQLHKISILKQNNIVCSSKVDTETSSSISNKNDVTFKDRPNRIKESRIGLKKPRDRLGERLGNKKLGSRKTNPLVGISSDSIKVANKFTEVTCQQPITTPVHNNDPNVVKDEDVHVTSSWGSWGDWSSSLASAATTISKGVGSVLESVESGMGIPDAETLAHESIENEKKVNKLYAEESEKNISEIKDDNETVSNSEGSYGFSFGGFSSLVSGVSDALETASNKVLIGGLDTLERIGKKTMDVLQDGDPGLKRRRAFLKSNSSNLSLVLKEARQRAIEEEEIKKYDSSSESSRHGFKQISMMQIWDSTDGPAHSEALTLVSTRCKNKTSSVMQDLPAIGINRLFPLINQIKAFSELPEENEVTDVTKALTKITRDVQLPLQFTKIITGWPALERSTARLAIQIQGFGTDECELNDVQRDLFEEVAQLVANSVGIVHKAAELSLVTRDLDCVGIARQFQEICSCLSSGLEQLADNICESITRSLPSSEAFVSSSVTNIYIQMAEANSFLQISLQQFTLVLVQVQAKQIASELL